MASDTQPLAFLKALTLEAQGALHGPQLAIEGFPFRVGRESRGPNEGWKRAQQDRRSGMASPNNDLYVWEQTREVFVSREHFEIVKEPEGYRLIDRNSALGTWVEGHLVGGKRTGGSVPLKDGDVIILGSYLSGFIFKFIVA